MEVGADGVAVITLENGKVNALHPTGTITSNFRCSQFVPHTAGVLFKFLQSRSGVV